MERRNIAKPSWHAWLPFAVLGGIALLAVPALVWAAAQQVAQAKEDEPAAKQPPPPVEQDPAKALKVELERAQLDLVRALQANRVVIQQGIARLNGPCCTTDCCPPPMRRADQVMDYRFGVLFGIPNAVLVKQLKLEAGNGLVVVRVWSDTAGSKAGLVVNDILLEINGKKVPADFAKFADLLIEVKADKEVAVVVLRDGKQVTLQVTLPDMAAFCVPAAGRPGAVPKMPPAKQ